MQDIKMIKKENGSLIYIMGSYAPGVVPRPMN